MRDFIAIGVGPFNLGLACLTDPLDELDGLFLEARDRFAWHPGMLLDDATLQVPFLADLVTMADPTSRFSFLNHLKQVGRLYPFYIRESFYPLRKEYDDYCRWAADQLDRVRFGQRVTRVEHDGDGYVVHTASGATHHGRRLVLGTGTQPSVPAPLIPLWSEPTEPDGPVVCHSADYLQHRERLQTSSSITVVGSGQSAAEIYADLLDGIDDHGYHLSWVTRSPRFFPMEYTKLTLELTSPEYSAYFQGLPPSIREPLLREQRSLYKGISGDLVDRIYDELYRREVDGGVPTTLVTNTSVTGGRRVGAEAELDLRHEELGEDFGLATEGLVLATGYARGVPGFLAPVRDRIRWDDRGRYLASPTYAIDHQGDEIFVQNAEEHTHGFVAPDLGMGAHRNAVLIAAMLGREVYPVEKRIAFQSFGIPDHLRARPGTPATTQETTR